MTRQDLIEAIVISLTEAEKPEPKLFKRYLADPKTTEGKKPGWRMGYGSWLQNNKIPREQGFVKFNKFKRVRGK